MTGEEEGKDLLVPENDSSCTIWNRERAEMASSRQGLLGPRALLYFFVYLVWPQVRVMAMNLDFFTAERAASNNSNIRRKRKRRERKRERRERRERRAFFCSRLRHSWMMMMTVCVWSALSGPEVAAVRKALEIIRYVQGGGGRNCTEYCS